MGIDRSGAKFILSVFDSVGRFENILTIGKQNLYITSNELHQIITAYAPDVLKKNPVQKFQNGDDFLTLLGARSIDSLDYSDYEHASITHDLNLPIPENLKNKYSLVFDGGSLEHIFNTTVALKNYMDLVKTGGDLIIITPGNNFFGHGFYQFSPELFFRTFTANNGFEIKRILASEIPDKWYEIVDPEKIKMRVELTNSSPVNLLIHAKKIEHVNTLDEAPQQSDYVSRWGDYINIDSERTPPSKNNFKNIILRAPLLKGVAAFIKFKLWYYYRHKFNSFDNRKFFKHVKK